MAGEIQTNQPTGQTLYAVLRNRANGQVYNTAGAAFEAFNSANWADYDVALTEQTGTGFYAGAMPAVAAGSYAYTVHLRAGASPVLADDTPVGNGFVEWDGSAVVTLTSLATQASVDAVDDYLDTEIAAIKARTDNLPDDPRTPP